MQSITLYKRLINYVFPYFKFVGIMLLAVIVYASTSALLVKTMKPMIDEGFVKQNMSAIYSAVITLVLITIVRGISFFIGAYYSRYISTSVVLDIRKEMFAHLQLLPHKFYDTTTSGEILSKFNYDVLQVTGAATNAIITLIREGVTVIVLLSFLLWQNWKLTMLIIFIAPIVGVIISFVSKRLRKLAKSVQSNMGEMNHILDENIKGQKLVKIHNSYDYESDKFNKTVKKMRNAAVKSETVSAITTPTIELIITIVLSIVIIIMAKQSSAGTLSSGGFITYIGMMAMLFTPIKKLTKINEIVQKGLAGSESIFGFLDIEKESNEKPEIETKVKFSGNLEFKNVNFKYLKETVLENINLTIKPKETIAIVGASGSGKSSLVSLIPRFYNIQKGQINLDNMNISEMNLQTLREQISFISQDNVLFNDTVIKNIAYAETDREIDLEKVKKSAKLAFATEFIDKLDKGFETIIGSDGQQLSGGQKQRISIARAIYKDSPIFILDEATSALDSESESKVQTALTELMKDKTSIIIAHRLSTVANADRIIVMKAGKIVEQGTHTSLLAKKAHYYKLHQMNNFSE